MEEGEIPKAKQLTEEDINRVSIVDILLPRIDAIKAI